MAEGKIDQPMISEDDSSTWKDLIMKRPPPIAILSSQMNMDLTQDGFIKKLVLKPGSSGNKPPEGSVVWVHYAQFVNDDPAALKSTILEDGPNCFRLDTPELTPGLNISVKSMEEDEVATFVVCGQYAKGPVDSGDEPGIPEGARLVYNIKLVNYLTPIQFEGLVRMIEGEHSTASFDEVLDGALNVAADADESSANRDYDGAIKLYHQSLNMIKNVCTSTDEENKRKSETVARLQSTLDLLITQYQNSKDSCSK